MRFDTVVIGGGHAGQEAALTRVRSGKKVCLVSAGLTLHVLEPGAEGHPYGLLKNLADEGVTVLRGDVVTGGNWDGMLLREVFTANGMDLQADEFVLATGRFFSRGLVADMNGIRESIFGADVDCPEDRSLWFDSDFLAPQPFESFGVKTDQNKRISIGGNFALNVYAAGKILGGKYNAGK